MTQEKPKRKCRCGGTGWLRYDNSNPMAVEPCGCDEPPEERSDGEQEGTADK